MGGFLCFTHMTIILVVFIFIVITLKSINKNREKEIESKIFSLKERLNCTDEEGRRILEIYDGNTYRVIDAIKNITCPGCKEKNRDGDDICMNCGHSLHNEIMKTLLRRNHYEEKIEDHYQSNQLAQQAEKNITRKFQETPGETIMPVYEGIPARPVKPDEEKGINTVNSIELGNNNLIISTDSGSSLEIPCNAITMISVYREEHEETFKLKTIKSINRIELTSHNEIYVCLIHTDSVKYKITEGSINFRKILGNETRPTFRENFTLFLEKLHRFCPDSDLDSGARNILRKASQLQKNRPPYETQAKNQHPAAYEGTSDFEYN